MRMTATNDYSELSEALLAEVSDAQVLRCDGEPAILFETSAELVKALTRIAHYAPMLAGIVNRFIGDTRLHLAMCDRAGSRVMVMFTSKVEE
jgi:hypothetical protein